MTAEAELEGESIPALAIPVPETEPPTIPRLLTLPFIWLNRAEPDIFFM